MEAKNYAAAAEIMDASDLVTIKHVGNKITVAESRADKAPLITETGVHAKFAQNDSNIRSAIAMITTKG